MKLMEYINIEFYKFIYFKRNQWNLMKYINIDFHHFINFYIFEIEYIKIYKSL
jgi:hypothetical protein